MGVMADSLGLDCADCHPGAGTDKADWVFDTPQKITARKMVNMVAGINKEYFNGVQQVTCYVCHHARDSPSTTVSLDNLYSSPNFDKDDVHDGGQKLAACCRSPGPLHHGSGWRAKLKTLTSYVMTGESIGYEGLGGNGQRNHLRQGAQHAHDRRSNSRHPDRAPSIWTYDGKVGWVTAPRGLLGEYQLEGNNAEGASVRGRCPPSRASDSRRLFRSWVSAVLTSIGENASPSAANVNIVPADDYRVIEGTGPRRQDEGEALLRPEDQPAGAGSSLRQLAHRAYSDSG